MVLADTLYLSILTMAFIMFMALAGVVAGEYRRRKRNKRELLKVMILMVWASLVILFRIAFGYGDVFMVVRFIHFIIILGLFVYFLAFITPLCRRFDRRLIIIESILGLIALVTAILRSLVSNIFIDVANLILLAAIAVILFFLVVRFLIRFSPRK